MDYPWNGSSILADNPNTGEFADLSDQDTYGIGADFGVSSRSTFALDVLENYFIDAPRLVQTTFRARDDINTFPSVDFT